MLLTFAFSNLVLIPEWVPQPSGGIYSCLYPAHRQFRHPSYLDVPW